MCLRVCMCIDLLPIVCCLRPGCHVVCIQSSRMMWQSYYQEQWKKTIQNILHFHCDFILSIEHRLSCSCLYSGSSDIVTPLCRWIGTGSRFVWYLSKKPGQMSHFNLKSTNKWCGLELIFGSQTFPEEADICCSSVLFCFSEICSPFYSHFQTSTRVRWCARRRRWSWAANGECRLPFTQPCSVAVNRGPLSARCTTGGPRQLVRLHLFVWLLHCYFNFCPSWFVVYWAS